MFGFGKKKGDVPEVPKVKGFRLTIAFYDGTSMCLTNTEREPLWRVQKWFIRRDSEKFLIRYDIGTMAIRRSEIKHIILNEDMISEI